uniref:Serine/threonine-protein kinase BSK1-like TPR repeats domain-containing protein n=1 Tax=Oryza glaberrima TaxID=4538 RepID=I1P0K0_ORYGL
FGHLPIEVAARCGARKDVETLFPVTSRIPCVHDWTVDGIINYAKSLPDVKDEEFCEAMLDMGKFQGREAVKNKDYRGAMHIYTKAIALNTRDASLFSNRSLCWLKLGEGEKALIDAEACRMMQPNWPEACYRQGAALMLLKDCKNACSSFLDGLKLEPENVEMNNALRLCLVQRKVDVMEKD